MESAQQDDSFVAADAFFNDPDAGKVLQSLSSSRLKRQSLSQTSDLPVKGPQWDGSAATSVQTRRRSQRFVNAAAGMIEADENIAGGVSSPARSGAATTNRSGVATSVMFGKAAVTRSPLPAPKSRSISSSSGKNTFSADVEDSAASNPRHAAVAPPALRSSVASDLFMSATSSLSASGDDLSALRGAIQALKSSTMPGASSLPPAPVPVVAPAPVVPPSYVSLSQLGPKQPAAALAPSVSESLNSLQHRVAKITLAGTTPAAVAPVPLPKVISPPPAASGVVASLQQLRNLTKESTPPQKSLPKTPGAPANTPASPSFTKTQQEGVDAAALDQDETVRLGGSFARKAFLAREKVADRTPYDGEDVIMSDAGVVVTPDAISAASTVSRKGNSSATADSGSVGPLSTSSRFRIEALRQGVTPLRVREKRASVSSPLVAEAPLAVEAALPAVAATAQPVSVPRVATIEESATNSPGILIKEKETKMVDEDNKVSCRIPSPPLAAVSEMADATTLSSNPLAESPVSAIRPSSIKKSLDPITNVGSPTMSSHSAVSNNPLFAGTPSHPTPDSVSMARRHSLSMSAAAAGLTSSMRTPSTGGSAASEGMKLAEKLHAAAEKLQTPVAAPAAGIVNTASSPAQDSGFKFQGDVQALLQALDASTPPPSAGGAMTPLAAAAAGPAALRGGAATGKTARALAAASTEERPKPQPRRRSSLSGSAGRAPILDLSGFNAEGERTAPGHATPLLAASKKTAAAAITTTTRLGISSPADADARPTASSSAEAAALRQQIADLEAEKKDAASLLAGYQGTIAELQDRHSAALVRLQSENSMLKSEAERIRAERADINSKFEILYKEKYAPLKTEAAALRRGADALRVRLAEEGANAKRISQLEAELSAAQAATAAAQQSVAAFKAEAEAAREAERLAEKRSAEASNAIQEAERRWAAKFAAEATRAEQALAAKNAEVCAWKDKHAAMAQQHDQAVHRAHLSQAGKERKAAEVSKKEEEICQLEVELRDTRTVLGQYKAENDKFALTKDKYKRALLDMENQVAAKEQEKQSLANLCSELLERLEKYEGKKG